MERWVGRVALVTGASSGIGYATAKKLAESGLKVVGCSRNIEKIQKLSQELLSSGVKGSVTAMKCDVGKEADILGMFSTIKEEFGGVDVCVNSAGMCYVAPLISGDTDQWRQMLEVDVLGLCICTRESIKSMRERNIDDGHIVHVNSLGGHRVLQDDEYHFHAGTKFATTALTEGLRRELFDLNSHIRMSQVCPGLVQSEFHERMYKSTEKADQLYSKLKCLEPGDIADAIVYALAAPAHVQVHDILIRPVEQST